MPDMLICRAKEAARRIPRPPAFTGKLAFIHCTSDKTTLAMWLMLDLRTSSIWLKIALPRQGEQRNMKRTCDVLELAFKISNASWAFINLMLLDNLLNSSNFLFSAASCKAQGKRGAPRRLASGGETAMHSFSDCDWTGITNEISSHLVMLRCNPRLGPLRLIIVTSSSTVDMCPPIVILSI